MFIEVQSSIRRRYDRVRGDFHPVDDDWAIDCAASHLRSNGVHPQILLDARFQVLVCLLTPYRLTVQDLVMGTEDWQ
jgi:hypothetical protein